MSKRRVTLTLDEDVVDELRRVGEGSLSAAVNAALRESLALRLHRQAALTWLDELDAKYGAPNAEDRARAAALLDEAEALGKQPSAKRRPARRSAA